MKYDFETLLSRKGMGSAKWDAMLQNDIKVSDGIVPLSVADMEFKNAPEIVEGLKQYLDKMVLGYTQATDSYYQAVINWMKNRFEYHVEKEWISETSGVISALNILVNSLTQKGDGILIMRPVYYPFTRVIEMHGRKVVATELINDNGNYTIDFDDFENKAADENTKMLILCSPHNPIGRVWSKAELEKVAEICLKHNVFIISDEIHNDLIMPPFKHTVLATLSDEVADNCAICTAPSKTFNLAGMQISNIIIKNEKYRKKFRDYREKNSEMFRNALSYKACEIAYTQCESWLEQLITKIQENRDIVLDFFKENFPEFKVSPLQGTYLMWIDFTSLNIDHLELEKRMTNSAQVFLDEGYIFGDSGKGFERINIACPSDVLIKALERIKKEFKS